MYHIGEALVGEGPELAHVDLVLGEKDGPVGAAFANALSQLSAGHTPLLAVIRPNLMAKPATLVIPKVTLRKGTQVREMFGPVQAAVAKAVADSVEEGAFGDRDLESLVILASIYLDPEASDYNRIYRYNYGATKLAITRALDDFPDRKTLLYEKDRAPMPSWASRSRGSGTRPTSRLRSTSWTWERSCPCSPSSRRTTTSSSRQGRL